MASEAVIAIVQREGADWYASEVIAPMLGYDFQGEVDVSRRVHEHMAGFPEPLRTECRAAVAALASRDSRQPEEGTDG